MTHCPRGRLALETLVAAAAAVVAMAITPTHAQVARSAPQASVDDYLEAFYAAYEPAAYDLMALSEADAAVQRAQHAMSPDVALEHELEWRGYGDLVADLTTTLRLPLYDSRASIEASLAAVDFQLAAASVNASRAAATLDFYVDLATYAALSDTSALVTRGLAAFATVPWVTEPGLEPLAIAPDHRPLFEAHQRLLEMHAFLTAQRGEVQARLSRSLRLVTALPPPLSLAELRLHVPLPPSQDTCMADGPEAAAAHLRAARTRIAATIPDVAPFRIELTGNAGVTVSGAAAHGPDTSRFAPAATVALHATLALPAGRRLGADIETTLSAVVSPSGASQSLRIAWPRPPLSPTYDEDPDRALTDELELIAANLRAMRRAVTQASSERSRLERALAWLTLDAGVTPGARTPPRSSSGGGEPSGPHPAIAAELADLATQLAFAELEELIATARLTVACGASL